VIRDKKMRPLTQVKASFNANGYTNDQLD